MSLSVGKIVLSFGLAFLLATGGLLTGAGKSPHAALAADLPDLVVTAFIAPDKAVIGQQIEISYTVTNQGTAGTLLRSNEDWTDRFRLSTDNQWEPQGETQDYKITYWDYWGGSLEPGSSYTRTQKIPIPQVDAGSYFLMVKTDAYTQYWYWDNGKQIELNEDNNVAVRAITLGLPDLVPTSVTAPTKVEVGEQIEVSWTVANQSAFDALWRWSDILYISIDNTWDGVVSALADATRTSVLAEGGSYTVSKTVGVPSVPAQSYYLLLKTDVGEILPESNEANNILVAGTITLDGPDLVPTVLTAPDKVMLLQSFDISWTVANRGTLDAQPTWYDYVYLSSDEILDYHDTIFSGSSHSSVLIPDSSYTATRTALLDKYDLPGVAGRYYLLIKTDAFTGPYDYFYGIGLVMETDEDNNVLLARAIDVETPDVDLVPTALIAPDTVLMGQQIEVSWTVANQGTADAQPYWADYVYLSTDSIWERDQDTKLNGDGYWLDYGLAAGSSYTATATVTIPSVVAGSYYLLLITDWNNNALETDLTNNVLALPVTIGSSYKFKLSVAGNGTTTPAAGTYIYESGTVVNISATPAAGWQFVNWTGDVANPNAATTTVTMNSDQTVTANFAQTPVYSLTIALAPPGGGTTNPAPGTYSYPAGTSVNITATPATGWQFVNWTGEVANPDSATTTVTMSSHKTVTANFSQIIYTLTVDARGNGRTEPVAGTYTYPAGTVVSIAATPDAGWRFDSWTGDVAATNAATTTVTIDADKTLTANFSLITYTLTVVIRGNGNTTPAAGTYTYLPGTVVNLTAAPAAGWQFVNWTGEVANPYAAGTTVTVDTDKTVTAHFIRVTIRGDANGDGSVNAQDVTAVERIIALLDPPTTGADANGDGSLNALDITKTERLVAGLD